MHQQKVNEMIQRIATRDGYGKRLAELDDKRIVVLAADLAESARVNGFKDKHPERFIQVGISEQDMFGMANGLALQGKIPITNTFAAFCMRAYEQARMICFNKANVKIVGHHSGISVGADGETQQSVEDISMFRTLPFMNVVVPCDAIEAQKALDALIKVDGPCYLRLSREPYPVITNEFTDFTIGKANIMKDGHDVLIVACGTMVTESLRAAKMLDERGITAAVMNMHTIKPLDSDALMKYARKTKAVVTVEEHSIYGGLGSAVCETLSLSKIPIKCLGIRDVFAESGTAEELFQKYGLTAENIMDYCHDVIRFKDEGQALHLHNTPTEQSEIIIKKTEPKTDPRNRIVKMSEADQAKVNGVLNKMFGGRRNT